MLHTARFSNLFIKFAGATALIAMLVAGLGFQIVMPAAAANTIYYVDCAGSDTNNGTSTTTPWKTMARASQPTYGAGDQILFKRGCTFSGAGFKLLGSGTVASPITIADYGTGNLPALDGVGTNEAAILIRNNQNVVIRNLDLTQHGQTPQTPNSDGKDTDQHSDNYMRAILDIRGQETVAGVQACGEPCTVRNVSITGLVVHDGSWNGIYVAGGLYQLDMNTYGYVDNILIQSSESRNNQKSGLDATSTYTKNITYAVTHITILSSYMHDNGADGIVLGPVEHGLIDSDHCAFNGKTRDKRVGCWSWDSHDVVTQFTESDHNQNPNTGSNQARDGGGFDLDLGTEDGLIQYSWSHDNVGEGILLMTWPIGFGFQRGTTHNAHLRYSIGERDGKALGGGVFTFGATQPALVYNNTIYYESARTAASTMYQAEGGAIDLSKWGKSGVPTEYIYNNIIIGNGTVTPGSQDDLMRDESGCTCTIDNNLYYRVEGGFLANWNGTVSTFAAWQAKGYDANGLNANPLFTGAFGGGPAAYHLSASSPAINRGRTVTQGLRGMGTRDYFGTVTPQGGAYDIGADEF